MKKRYSMSILMTMLTFSSSYQTLLAAEPARASGDVFNLSALGVKMSFAELYNNDRGFYVSTEGKLYGYNEEDVDASRPKQTDTTTFNYLFNTHDYMPYLDNEVIIDVEIMGFSRFLLTESNKVFVEGYNNSGQLGNGTTSQVATFTDVTSFFPNLNDSNIISIEHSGDATYVLTDDGRVFTYGLTRVLGDNTPSNLNSISTPVEITDFFVDYDQEEDPIIQISLGAALTESGVVYAWGNHFSTNLVPTSVFDNSLLNAGDYIVSILSMRNGNDSGMLVLSNEGRVFGIGNNSNHALGFANSSSTFSTFTELGTSTFASGDKITFLGQGFLISEFGRVFSWGSHTNGKTGQGENVIFSTVPLVEITEIVDAHLADDEKFVFGRNKTAASASVLITNEGRAVGFGSGFAIGYPNVGTSAPYFLGVTVNPGKVTYTIDSLGGPQVGPFYWAKEYRVYYNTMLPSSFNKPNLITFPNYTFVGYFTDAALTDPLPMFNLEFADEDLTIYIKFVFTGTSSSQSSSTQPGSSIPPTSTPNSGDSTTPGEPSPIGILPILGAAAVLGLGGASVYWFVILKKSVTDLKSWFLALLKKKKKEKDEDESSKKK
jgi:alpha-tubulin suppressor-like RCC1 family protein